MTKVDLKDAYFMVPIEEEFSSSSHSRKRHTSSTAYHFAPLALHQDPKANCCPAKTSWNETDCLHIENILILAEPRNLARNHVIGPVRFFDMCVLEPMQSIGFMRSLLGLGLVYYFAALLLPCGEGKLGRVVLI